MYCFIFGSSFLLPLFEQFVLIPSSKPRPNTLVFLCDFFPLLSSCNIFFSLFSIFVSVSQVLGTWHKSSLFLMSYLLLLGWTTKILVLYIYNRFWKYDMIMLVLIIIKILDRLQLYLGWKLYILGTPECLVSDSWLR